MRTVKAYLKNLLLLFSTLLFICIAGELAVRIFSDLSVPLVKRDQLLGSTFHANSSREIIGPESKQKVLVQINEEGFRTPSRPHAKPADTIRIALIGDSQIAAVNTREENTLALLLENKLNLQYPQIHWEVFNFGISGANTAQEFNLYTKLVRNYTVDVVVCAYYNGNDFSDNSLRLSRSPRIYMDFMQGSEELITIYPAPSRKKFSNWLNKNSRLYVWQKHFIGDAVNNFLALGGAGKNQKIRDEFLIFVDDPDDDTLAYSWKINEKIIQEFNRQVLGDNAIFLFLSIPHGIETTDWQWQEYQQMAAGTKYEAKIDRLYPEKALTYITKKHGIDNVFLRKTFAEHLQSTKTTDQDHYLAYREGKGHLNENGNRLMADTLLEHFKQNGTIWKLMARVNRNRQTVAKDH